MSRPASPTSRSCLWPGATLWLGVRFAFLACLLLSPALLDAREITTTDPNKVKAGFLSKFARYVTWPPNALPADGAPWRIGILGKDPFGETLDKTLHGRSELKHEFQILRSASVEDLLACHIVFVAVQDKKQRQEAMAVLKNKPILTVGDDPDFLDEGGIIRFRLSETLLMDISVDQARSANLDIQTKMLELAGSVLEKGKLRVLR